MAIVVLTPTAQGEFDALPKAIRARIEAVLQRLQRWPDVSGAKPLAGDLSGRWRMRTGDYRIQFYVEPGKPARDDKGGKRPRDDERGETAHVEPATPDKVKVEKVGHRDGFYD